MIRKLLSSGILFLVVSTAFADCDSGLKSKLTDAKATSEQVDSICAITFYYSSKEAITLLEAGFKPADVIALADTKVTASEIKRLRDAKFTPEQVMVLAANEETVKAAQAPKLDSFNFAVGLGALFLRNGNDILNTAVDGGVLRVTNEERYKLGFWLSTNTFFRPDFLADTFGVRPGLFMAAQVGSGNNADVLNSFAVGVSLASSSQPKGQGTAALAFQLGYGLTRIQTFANGYAAGMTMPTGTNQPVMTRTIGRGPVLIVSTAIF